MAFRPQKTHLLQTFREKNGRQFILLFLEGIVWLGFLCPLGLGARSGTNSSGSESARLLALVQETPNWPYIWLARLESGKPSEKMPVDSTGWEAQRLFLKGVAYFFIAPEYNRHRDFGRRLQILEKVLDNWKDAVAVLRKSKQPRALKEAEKISAARMVVFQRYLKEKRTRRYQGQTLAILFKGVLPRPCRVRDDSFVARVVCTLKNAKVREFE